MAALAFRKPYNSKASNSSDTLFLLAPDHEIAPEPPDHHQASALACVASAHHCLPIPIPFARELEGKAPPLPRLGWFATVSTQASSASNLIHHPQASPGD
ncbi:hypothetical protein HBI56_217070 [Parastagonospora nodorum]|nr:hypothetical protein HBH53_000420 [Parastagonospora nodorum]KAH3965575.1 hypothetical protein HBH52_204260 [Parastagonospora nodorum]KAH3971227.1 hypothetical protein HBH51_109970 [Parastagonospora nodorum]KAH4058087.1 hypothetical protein HBH49_028570 [Parastagonospora nodorum]KAH4102545.1 hypothetical protein HBH46_126520 [Parastagonospora nodorum]